jgi:DNA-3-methyladenine glycosylase
MQSAQVTRNISDFPANLPEEACKPLPTSFYRRPAPMVAWDLLGKIIVHGIVGGAIVETEAYLGKDDLACHASRGRTPRNEIFYDSSPGTAYVFQCHGGNYLFNVLTSDHRPLECVLVRAVEPIMGIERMRMRRPVEDHELTSGPGKLSKALGITKTVNGSHVTKGPVLILGSHRNGHRKGVSPRIGISKDRHYPFRYYIVGNRFVSRTPQHKYQSSSHHVSCSFPWKA